MLLLHGDTKTVTCTRYGHQEVWMSGVGTAYNILKPYMHPTIVHIRNEHDLEGITWDLSGTYVINSGDRSMTARIVHRGAFCIHDTFDQGLYRLRHI